MSEELFRKEKIYQGSLGVAKEMRRKNIITAEEYTQIQKFLIAKYRPVFGVLFSHSC